MKKTRNERRETRAERKNGTATFTCPSGRRGRRFRSIVFILSILLFGLFSLPVNAEAYFDGIYWVEGKLVPPTIISAVTTPTPSVNGRTVVIYKDDPANGYAQDTTGTAGNSGRSGEFMINAMEDWRMPIVPGTYKIAVVKGTDGWGADPIDITITDNGWNRAPDLVLAQNAGINTPPPRALVSWLAAEVPTISNIRFDGKLYQKLLVEGPKKLKFVINEQPKISATVKSGNVGIDKTTLQVIADEGTASQRNFGWDKFSDYSEVLSGSAPVQIDFSLNYKTLNETLQNGSHIFKIIAGNIVGSTAETASISVMAGSVQLIGYPLTWPSPLHLATQNEVLFQYGISKDANINIYLFDISGQIVKMFSFKAGEPGGQAGGEANPNKIKWGLALDQGSRLGAGIYVWEIVDADNKKVIGHGKLPAAP